MRPEDDCPVGLVCLSNWGKTGRPVIEEVLVLDVLLSSREGTKQGLVFWSKQAGEASYEGEMGDAGGVRIGFKCLMSSIFCLIRLGTLVGAFLDFLVETLRSEKIEMRGQ